MADMPDTYTRVREDGKLKPLPDGITVTGRGSGYAHHYWNITADHVVGADEGSDIAHILDGGYLFGSRVEGGSVHPADGLRHYKVVGYID